MQSFKSARKYTALILAVALVLCLIPAAFAEGEDPNAVFAQPAVIIDGEVFSGSQVYYHFSNEFYNFTYQYEPVISIIGLNAKPGITGLREQPCGISEGSWRDYFLDKAITTIARNKALVEYANSNGIVLTAEDEAEIDEQYKELETLAQRYKFGSVDNLLAKTYGTGVTGALVKEETGKIALAAKAFESYQNTIVLSPEEITDVYASYNGDHDYFGFCIYTAASLQAAETILGKYNSEELAIDLAEETDVEVKLNEALKRTSVAEKCLRIDSVEGSYIPDYKDWMMNSAPGEATIFEKDGKFSVVALNSHEDNNYKLANIRVIRVDAIPDANGMYSEDAKLQTKVEAERILNEWKAGEATEDSFAALAVEYSEDESTCDKGGLIENIQKGQLTDEMDKFCFGGRKSGDTDIVCIDNSAGCSYRILYYVGEGELCRDYIARTTTLSERGNAWLNDLVSKFEIQKTPVLDYIG